jgi:hypothetical protein
MKDILGMDYEVLKDKVDRENKMLGLIKNFFGVIGMTLSLLLMIFARVLILVTLLWLIWKPFIKALSVLIPQISKLGLGAPNWLAWLLIILGCSLIKAIFIKEDEKKE